MANFASIENGSVTRVVVYNGDDALTWLSENLGGVWVPGVTENGTRAGIGMTYDEAREAFITVSPYPSWVLSEETFEWLPPVALPDDADTVGYTWDEEAGEWVAVPEDAVE